MFDNLNQSNKSKEQDLPKDHSGGIDMNKSINFLPSSTSHLHKKLIPSIKTGKKEMHQPDKTILTTKTPKQSFLIKLNSFFNKNKLKKKDSVVDPITNTSQVKPIQQVVAQLDQQKQAEAAAMGKNTHLYSTKMFDASASPIKAPINESQLTAANKKEPLITPSTVGSKPITAPAPNKFNNNVLHQASQADQANATEDTLEVNLLPVKKRQFSHQQIFLSYFMAIIICLLATITPYVYLLTHNKTLSAGITSLETQIDLVNTKNKELNKEVALMKPFSIKLQSLLALLENHIYWSRLFPFLERYTIGNVYYTSLSISNDNLVHLNGAALNLRDLAEQLVVYQREPLFIDVNLESFNFVEPATPNDPKIEFSLSFNLSPDIIQDKIEVTN